MNDMTPLFKVRMEYGVSRVLNTLSCGYIGQGPKVEEFEQSLGMFLGQVLTTNSCTSALDLAYHLIGIGEKTGYVISTPMTCLATNSPLVHRHASVVWADVHPRTGLIDPESVEGLIRDMGPPLAVVTVDWAGCPVDYEALRDVCGEVPIVQDAAHSILSVPYGDYIAWSFQAIKHLTTGDGGALKVPPEQYERAKLLRWYGFDRSKSDSMRCVQKIDEIGFKYHMNDIAAAIGLCNIKNLTDTVINHRNNARIILEELGEPFDERSSYWFVPLIVEDRYAFIEAMLYHGIQASPVHKRNDNYGCFRQSHTKLPGVDHFDSHSVGIPCGWWISPGEARRIGQVARQVKECQTKIH